MDSLFGDLRYAARGLLRTRGVASIAVIALALGIGMTTVMFSIVYGALYRGLPFPNGERVMSVRLEHHEPGEGGARVQTRIHEYADWKERLRSFEELAAYYGATINVTSAEQPDRYLGAHVSTNTLATLGVAPVLGRGFTADDGRPGAPLTILLGHAAWRDHFGADPAAVGRVVKVNGEAATVIGVMGEGFRFPVIQDVWVPLRLDPLAAPRGEGQGLTLFGRLRPGVSLDAANVELLRTAEALAVEHHEPSAGFSPLIRPFTREFLSDDERRTLLAMMATVSLVLLIACANVANLMLARAAVRTRDMAIRVSLGASRRRVVGLMLAESVVLASVGALLGAALARVGIDLFARAVAPTEPPFWFAFRLDGPILAFVAAAAVLAALLSGVIPALKASSANVESILRDESRGSSSLHLGRLSRGLVVAEIAMSMALLVASGLMIRGVIDLDRLKLPYATRDVFTARIALFDQRFPDAASRERFWETVERSVGALPGVTDVALVDALPGMGGPSAPVQVEGATYASSRDVPRARGATVTPTYFRTLGAAPVQGRVFTALDGADAPRVAIVNESFARERFPDGGVLGRRIRVGGLDTAEEWREVVGVVPDLGMVQLNERGTGESRAGLYVPLAQKDQHFMAVVARTSTAPLALTGPVREAVARADAETPIYQVNSLQGMIDQTLWFYRVFGTLFTVFGGAALFLASVGLYGVMSFSVSRRAQEMGIRMALGAQAAQVRALVLRQGMVQIAIGMAIGTGLSFLVARGLTVMIFGAKAWDLPTYALVFAILGLTGLAATAAPAARATRVDPIEALRAE